MRINTYDDIIKIFDEIADKTQDTTIEGIAEWVHTSSEREHKPTLALVSFNFNHTERLNMIKKHFEIEIPEEIKEMIDGKPACLMFDYSEAPCFSGDEQIIDNRIMFGLPSQLLKNYRVVICDGIKSKREWLELSSEIDIICLVVNATMAMNQMERQWLKECAIPLFLEDEIIIQLTNLNLLNEEGDILEVREAVTNAMDQMQVAPRIFEEDSKLMEWMIHFLENDQILERNRKRTVKNAMTAITEQMKAYAESVSVDSETVQTTISQLKKQQKSLELAGKLASESILENAFNKLKSQLCDSIRDYNEQMFEKIKEIIEKTPLDQLENVYEKVDGYISGAWDYYIKVTSEKTNADMKVIEDQLMKQMETDVSNMITELDEAAQRTIYNALGLGDEFMSTLCQFVFYSDKIMLGSITKQIQKETRNMMLLSIPLFFVNPLVSVGNLFIANAYGKHKINNQLKDAKQDMIKHIEFCCNHNIEKMIYQVELDLDDQMRAGAIKIMSSYNELIHKLEDKVLELEKEQKERIQLKDYLKEKVEVSFPDLEKNL